MNTKKTLLFAASVIALFGAGFISASFWLKRVSPSYTSLELAAPDTAAYTADNPYEAARSRAIPGLKGAYAVGLGPTGDSTMKVIQDAGLELEVGSVQKTHEALSAIARELDGEVLIEQSNAYQNNLHAYWMVKIRPDRLHQIITRIEKLGKIQHKNVSLNDVTEEYVDLTARLENARKVEKRLSDLLKFQTNKLADVLAVERELERIGEKIESLEGRIKYLNSLTSLSRLTVNYHEPVKETVQAGIGITRTLKNAFLGAANTFINTLSTLIRFTGWLIAALIYVLLLCVLARLGYWVVQKRIKCA